MRDRKQWVALLVLSTIPLTAGCSLSERPHLSLNTSPSPAPTVQVSLVAVSPSPPLSYPSPPPYEAGGITGLQPTGSPVVPAPLPTKEGTLLYLSAGCPNPEGVEVTAVLSRKEALEVLNQLITGNREQQLQVTDPALWPLLPPEKGEPFWEGNLSEPHPARESPYADLLTNACGVNALEALWWVEVCPGSPPSQFDQCPPGIRGHFFFIHRGGRWLLWGMG